MAREILCINDLSPTGFCLDVNGQLTPAGQPFTLTDGTNTETIAAGDALTVTGTGPITATVGATDTLTIALCLSADADNILTIDASGCLKAVANVVTNAVWDDTTNTVNITFTDGSVVPVPIIDQVGVWISDFTIAGDVGTPDLVNNHETLTIVGEADSGIQTTITDNTVTISFDCSEALDTTGFATC